MQADDVQLQAITLGVQFLMDTHDELTYPCKTGPNVCATQLADASKPRT